MTPVADAWRRQAARDLAHARKSLDMEDFEWACTAAQQAVEKLLMAMLINAGRAPRPIPDLATLARLLDDAGLLTSEDHGRLERLGELDSCAAMAREPPEDATAAPGDILNAECARQALAVATTAWTILDSRSLPGPN